MPLDKSALASALAAILDGSIDEDPPAGADGFASTPTVAGQRLAKAYADYAGAGMFGTSTVDVSLGEAPLAATLGASLVVPGTPATHAAAWGAGLTAFWTGAPVAGAQFGTTAPPAGTAVLVAALTALFANQALTVSAAADAFADALDICTKTVTAAVTPPPGTVLPIS